MAVDLRQAHFRFGIDELAESTHGWYAAEDTNVSGIPAGKKFLLRFVEQESGGISIADVAAQLQYNLNSGGWNNVTTSSSVVKAVAVAAFADGANCTQRLTGSGTFETSGAGCSEDGLAAVAANDIAASGCSEAEFGLMVVPADVDEGDEIAFRLTVAVTTITNDTTPTLTVPKFKLIQGPINDYGTNPNTASFPGTPTEGNLLICRSRGSTLVSAGSIPDWTLAIGSYTSTGVYSGLWYKVAGADESADVVLTWGTSSSMIIEEWSGFDGTPTLDKVAYDDGEAGTETSHASGTTDTTTADDELCLAGFELSNAGTAWAFTNGFALDSNFDGKGTLASKIISSAAAISTTASWTTSLYASGLVATFKDASTDIELVIADASHGHTAGAPALVQAQSVVVASAAHAITSLGGGQEYTGIPDVGAYEYKEDGMYLETAQGVVIADADHDHTAGEPALSQSQSLVTAGGAHAHTAGSPTLTQGQVVAVSGALHAHSAGGVVLVQAQILHVLSCLHPHTAGGAILAYVESLIRRSRNRKRLRR